MRIDLSDQKVAITGAANGLGRAITQSFIQVGCRVLALDSDKDALAELSSMSPERIDSATVDVADFEALEALAKTYSIDHLVCAAACGSGKTGFPFWTIQPHEWQRVIDVTLMGTVNATQAFAPSLLQSNVPSKSVLLITSVAGQIGSQTDPPYSASKAAVISFAQIAAKDFAAHGVRVNALSPGMVKTDLSRSFYNASQDATDLT
ncbi:MAG: SDR family NAD(P)-dependent oxidoreductase, partial [Planctomycetaceae bacterium]